jgi:hypothetical protein
MKMKHLRLVMAVLMMAMLAAVPVMAEQKADYAPAAAPAAEAPPAPAAAPADNVVPAAAPAPAPAEAPAPAPAK